MVEQLNICFPLIGCNRTIPFHSIPLLAMPSTPTFAIKIVTPGVFMEISAAFHFMEGILVIFAVFVSTIIGVTHADCPCTGSKTLTVAISEYDSVDCSGPPTTFATTTIDGTFPFIFALTPPQAHNAHIKNCIIRIHIYTYTIHSSLWPLATHLTKLDGPVALCVSFP